MMHSELQALLNQFTQGKEVSYQDWRLFLDKRSKLGGEANLNALTLLLILSEHLQWLPEEAHPDIYLMLFRLSPEHLDLIKKDLLNSYAAQFDKIFHSNPNQPKTTKQLSAYITKVMLAYETLTVHRRNFAVEKELFARCLDLCTQQFANGYLEYCLGWMHYYGIGTGIHVGCAIICFTQAVEKRCAIGSYCLAICWEESKEATDNNKRADCLLAAAKRGIPEAQFLFAENRYRRGLRVRNGASEEAEKKFQEAVNYWEKAAHQGHPEAQYELGSFYDTKSGGKKDLSKAVKWYEEAARQGQIDAINRLAFFYAHGLGVTQNFDKAIEFYMRAIAQGDEKSIFSLMNFYLSISPNEQKAIELFESLTQYNGHFEAEEKLKLYAITSHSGAALFAIGNLYARKKNVYQRDTFVMSRPNFKTDDSIRNARSDDHMVEWYTKAAEVGNLGAKHCLKAYYQKQSQLLNQFQAPQTSEPISPRDQLTMKLKQHDAMPNPTGSSQNNNGDATTNLSSNKP